MHDAHIHLAMEPLKSNLNEIVEKFKIAGGKYILTQATESNDFDENIEIANRFKEIVHLALGLHPTTFEENTIQKAIFENISLIAKKEMDDFEKMFLDNLNNPTLKAIGETGLDYFQMTLNKEINEDIKEEIIGVQNLSFKKQLELALKHNFPLSIHARDINGQDRCVKDVLTTVAQEGRGLLRGCFHSYTGNIKFVQDILDLGFHIGFNAIITYKSGQDVREILKKTPIERILFETDGPFLPPQSVRKNKKIKEKFAQPYDVKEIIAVASEVKNISPEILERQSDENYEQVFLSR